VIFLRQEVADLAARRAEEIISKGLTDKDQDNLVNEFIEMVERLH
jgi:F0F1-type ATP synthase membrane subunit b/b'